MMGGAGGAAGRTAVGHEGGSSRHETQAAQRVPPVDRDRGRGLEDVALPDADDFIIQIRHAAAHSGSAVRLRTIENENNVLKRVLARIGAELQFA
jgi:hypothetical protein